MHPLVLRLLVNSYLYQKARVSWGNHLSQYFNLENGVKQGGVLSPLLFTCYIDNLLIKLEESGYGCHIRHIFMAALSYADDITLLSPSLRGLNEMLHICSLYADNFDITFNSKKTVCIKFGEQTRQYETIKLNNKTITWVDSIKHLGNYFDTTMSDKTDCQSKISAFIGSVNKLKVNFGHLQGSVLSTLFKSYCCSYYSLWKLDSLAFKGVCTSWNRGVRTILHLPFTTHTYMLGPLMNQAHMSLQLYKRCARFLYGMKQCRNYIVRACFNNAMQNARTPLGHNLAFFRNKYGIDIFCDEYNHCMKCIRKPKLKTEHVNNIEQLRSLLDIRNGAYYIEGFLKPDIDTMIEYIATT